MELNQRSTYAGSKFIHIHEHLSGSCCAAGCPRLPNAWCVWAQRQKITVVHAAKQIKTIMSHRRVESAILLLALLTAGSSKFQPQELCGGGE